MILVIDIDDAGSRVGAIDNDGARWFRVPGRDAFAVLGKAINKALNPSAIVVTQTKPGSGRKATWSVIRSAIAESNALSFAFGVPVADVQVTGVETDEELATLARSAAAQAKKQLIAPSYSGEPNITKPRDAVRGQ